MKRISMLCLLLMLSLPGMAQSSTFKDFAGTWVMRLGDRNLFVLTLTSQGTALDGSMVRPAHYSSSNGTYANLSNDVCKYSIMRIKLEGETLHFVAQSAKDAKDEDAYAMTVEGGHAALAFDDIPPGIIVAPLTIERGAPDAQPATDWHPNRLYTAEDSSTPSAEMKAIFDADQKVRMTENIDWNQASKDDVARRAQTRKLLAAGALHTGKDFEEAAFVFQHGDSHTD